MITKRPVTLYAVSTKPKVGRAAELLEQGGEVRVYTSLVELREAMVRRGLNRRDYRVVTFRIIGGW